jgi:MFS family permease
MLVFSPIIFLLSLYMFLVYGYLYLIFTAMPVVFTDTYGFTSGSIGLTYIGLGIGSFFGLVVSGATSDRLAQRMASKAGGDAKPEYRLPIVVVAAVVIPIGLFCFGWTAELHQHWVLPIVGTAIVSFGVTLAFMAISTYLIDAYGAYAASAVAASTVLRSLGGALLPLSGGPMFAALGLGWGSSLLAFIAIAMIPVPVVLIKYGESIRQKTHFSVKREI